MSGFLTSLRLIDDGDGSRMVLEQPLRYRSDLLAGIVDVQSGFVTDFASIPKVLWNVLPPHGAYDRPAIVHDKLYQDGTFQGVAIDRGTADRVLLEGMKVVGVSTWQRWAIFAGVRTGGFIAWKHYRESDSEPLSAA